TYHQEAHAEWALPKSSQNHTARLLSMTRAAGLGHVSQRRGVRLREGQVGDVLARGRVNERSQVIAVRIVLQHAAVRQIADVEVTVAAEDQAVRVAERAGTGLNEHVQEIPGRIIAEDCRGRAPADVEVAVRAEAEAVGVPAQSAVALRKDAEPI